MNKAHPAIILASWFYSGFLKPAPGTWGSLAALPFGVLLLYNDSLPTMCAAIAIVFVVGLWSAKIFDQQSGTHDNKSIVIDEVAGQWIALIPALLTWQYILMAFVLFRAFDILKPWPISFIDKRLGGAMGVMLDDVFAGIFAGTIVLIVRIYYGG